jgi:hypothetical protein
MARTVAPAINTRRPQAGAGRDFVRGKARRRGDEPNHVDGLLGAKPVC